MRTVIIVQARMGSTRLPGKVLKTVLGKPLLTYQLERLKRSQLAHDVVVATTVNASDQPIVSLCNQLQVPCFRGSEDNVLARYHDAAHEHRAELVVRSTSDCPLIDPHVVDQVIRFYLDHRTKFDYVSNIMRRTFPRGMDTEVFSIETLDRTVQQASDPADLEHVTPFMESHPKLFRLGNVEYVSNQSRHRWTVDTAEDFRLISNMLTELYPQRPDFTLEDCLQCFERHPDWYLINANIKQKA